MVFSCLKENVLLMIFSSVLVWVHVNPRLLISSPGRGEVLGSDEPTRYWIIVGALQYLTPYTIRYCFLY
jgi:hypothetical protein